MFKKITYRTVLMCNIILACGAQIIAQPGNDDPCGAIELAIEMGGQCTPSNILSWIGATATSDFADPKCASYATGDIWFTFTLPDPADIFITSLAGNGNNAITDGGMELYYNNQGCTGSYFLLRCDDDGGAGSMPQIALKAQAAGTYYIRFWDYKDETSGDIGGICVAATPVPTNTQNDDPCTAMELTVLEFEICTPGIPLSWSDATATASLALPECGLYLTGDIWFSFTLTDTSDLYISTAEGIDPGAITDGALTLYAADACDGTLTELACQDDQGSDMMPKFVQQAVLPGHYFLRFWDRDNSTSGNIGGICIAAQPSVVYPLLNDDPCGATELIVVSDTTCIPDNPQFWSNATATLGFSDLSCGSYTTGDIWFKFSLVEASDIFITTLEGTGIGIISDGAMALYAANDCDGPFLSMVCDDDEGPGNMPQIKLYAVPAGDYYIRFWDYADKVSGNIGGICVAALPTASTVTNDNCFSAIAFPAINTDGSCSSVSVNTEGATGSPIQVCDGIADDDVWYSFIVPAGIPQISFQITVNGDTSAQIFRLLKGPCDDQVFAGCFNASEGIFTDLIEGQIYYIRTMTAGIDTAAQFDICLRALAPPVNDDPCGAITLIPNDTTPDCLPDDPIAWQYATASDVPDPGCGNFMNGDVWFKFELTFKADFVIKSAAGTGTDAITDAAMAFYREGVDCNDLERLTCNDDASPSELMPGLSDYAIDPGIYYIRFWDYYGAQSGNIGGLCVAATPTISTLENDQCAGAIPFPEIPADQSCSEVHVNTSGATGSINGPFPGFNDDDVWYSFTVPLGVSSLLFDITTNFGNAQHVLCLYSSCGLSGSIGCFLQESGRFDNLVEGVTYVLQVYTLDLGVTSDFNICLKTIPPPPSNDECTGAIPFPAISSDGSCAIVSVNTTWATSSAIFACEGQSNDVWYSFVVPDGVTELIADVISISRLRDEGFELMTGDCGNLESVYCLIDRNSESGHLYQLIPGQTYYLRVFTSDSRLFVFDLCLRIPPPPPANDLCPDAIPFPEIPADGSCATVIATTSGATGDNSEACSYIYDDDVWYSFVMPLGSTGITVMTTPISGAVSSGVGIYGGDCDHLEFIGCFDFRTTVIHGLVGGQTYFARAYTSFANEEATFEICISVVPPPPVNDDCSGAIAFPVIPLNGDWVSVEGSTISGTDSGLAACNGSANDDVWLSFVVPVGQERLIFSQGYDTGLVLELYSGDCDHLELLDCFGASNSSTAFVNLIPEATYYLRVYNIEFYNYSDYKIEISVPQLPLNDFCEDALEFPPIPTDGSCVALSANSALATSSGITGCSLLPNNDVWFKFTVPDNYTAVILSLETAFNNMYLQVFGGSCDNLVEQECLYYPYKDDISGLESGATYWIQAFPILGISSFSLCLSVPPLAPSNDNCPDALSITGVPGVFSDPGPQTTDGATKSDQPVCFPFAPNGNVEAYDVWYSFVTDDDGGNATITVNFNDPFGAFDFFNLHLQGFEGECDNFTTLSCLENAIGVSGYDDTLIVMKLFGLAPSTKYYFRVFPTSYTHNYVPVNFTVFAEGTALSPTTGIEEDRDQEEGLSIIRMYPSPAHNLLNLEYSSDVPGKTHAYMTDILGHIVLQKELVTKQGNNYEKLFFNKLTPGLYFLFIENEKGMCQPKKFVVE